MRPHVPLAALLALGCTGCGTPAGKASAAWTAITAWQGDAPVLRVKTGRPDASTGGLQVVGVDDRGRVIHVRFDGETPTATVLHTHGVRFIGLAVADVDPRQPGEEIYAGGWLETADGKPRGGVVLQVRMTAQGPSVVEIGRGAGFVHAIEAVAAAGPDRPARLVVADYAGSVRTLTPTGTAGPWTDTRLHDEPASVGEEDRKAKEVAVLAPTPRGERRAVVLFKGGRAVQVDVDVPGSGRTVHEEPGGLSRACDDGAGGCYVCGYAGRVVRLRADGPTLRADVVWTDPAKELRGVARGRFPLAGAEAGSLAVYGYSQVCRVLTTTGAAVVATDVFRDTANGHGLVSGDLLPTRDGDELVLASYSNRIVVLAAPR